MKLLLLVCVIFLFVINASKKPKTLVFVKDDFSKYEYSLFFKSLKKRGHKLIVKPTSAKGIKLQEYGEFNYDNLVILDTTPAKLSELGVKSLLEFIDSGRNVLVGLNTKSSEIIKKFVDRCGIDIHSSNSMIRDDINYDLKKGDILNNVIYTNNYCHECEGVIPKTNGINSPILYKGIGLSIKKHNHLGFSILNGNSNTYSVKGDSGPIEKNIINSGSEISLVSALQTRLNGRITVIGSTVMLTNKYINSKVYTNKKVFDKSGNEMFIKHISEWTFGEKSILKAENIKHFKINDHTINPNRYRIKDDVEYHLDIFEYKLNCDCWKPFVKNDIQFEFIRLDSFIRQPLKHDDNGHYYLKFKLPDVFGVYKFTVDYKRHGWSYLFTENIVSVRPFRHDEYKRFLPMAYPYYMGTFSMIIGFIIFTFVFMWGHKDGKKIW